MSMPRPTSETLGFRHHRRPLKSDERIPAMPSLLDQIAQINAMTMAAEADGDADNDSWQDADGDEDDDGS
jgi:hypothetical protein